MNPRPDGSSAVDVVIVNWNAGPLLAECVSAITAGGPASDLRVIVVDNASGDGSLDGLDPDHGRLTIIRNADNLGFGRACNQGAASGDAPHILFLNPDVVATPAAIAEAARHLGERPAVGVVGLRLTDRESVISRSTARRPTPRTLFGQSVGLDRLLPRVFPPLFSTDWDHADTRSVDQVMGAFLMIDRSLFERLGGFDERFFVYFEDVDLCLRVREAGLDVVHLATASVIHGGQGTTRQVKDRRLFYFTRSKALFLAKHHGRMAAMVQLAVDLAGQIPIRVATSLMAGRVSDARASLRAAWMIVRALPDILSAIGTGQASPRGGPSRPATPSRTPRSSARRTESRPPDASQ